MIRARPTRTLAAAALALAIAAPGASGKGSPPDAIRIGGPSAPNEAKVAIVGSDRSLRRHRFRVLAANGETVLRGRLKRAPGKPDPWRHAYAADLSSIARPGSYRVVVGRLHSPAWRVDLSGGRMPLLSILQFFAANRDGDEPSPIHGPAHLNDAIVHPDAPVHAGERIGIAGGWMDAGDTLHFTQTTAFAAALLQAAALLDPTDAAALEEEADVGIRWLVKAHPAPDLFIAQVGDERDHDLGFRDPADDDASAKPGIGTRFAYPEIGGDLGGKAAAALALAYRRTGDPALLTAAQEWYAAGKAAGRAARPLRQAGYPAYAGNFYAGDLWQDSLAAGAVELYRATCAAGVCVGTYLDDFRALIAGPPGPDGNLGVIDSFASFAAADACGAFGDGPLPGEAGTIGCDVLRRNGKIAVGQARGNAFGMPGYFSWGTTATNGGSGALAALATATPRRAAPAAARSPPGPATTCSGATRSGAASSSATAGAARAIRTPGPRCSGRRSPAARSSADRLRGARSPGRASRRAGGSTAASPPTRTASTTTSPPSRRSTTPPPRC